MRVEVRVLDLSNLCLCARKIFIIFLSILFLFYCESDFVIRCVRLIPNKEDLTRQWIVSGGIKVTLSSNPR